MKIVDNFTCFLKDMRLVNQRLMRILIAECIIKITYIVLIT